MVSLMHLANDSEYVKDNEDLTDIYGNHLRLIVFVRIAVSLIHLMIRRLFPPWTRQ